MASAHCTLTVLCSGGLKAVLVELAPNFERTSGRTLALSFGPATRLMSEIEGGAPFDLVILTPPLIDALAQEGKIVAGSAAPIARTGVGLAVRRGAPKPDIGSVAALRQALVAARSIAYTKAGQSGMHFARVLETLGIADAVNAKAKIIPGGAAGELIVTGEAEMAVQLLSELMAVPGIEVAGPLPAELQNYVVLTAGIGMRARDATGARALIDFLTAPAAAPVILAKGMETV